MKELQQIQGVLKAPKGQYNAFGKYKYRSCEDIVEAVKPLLTKYECYLTMSDELVLIGDRYYIKATCTITNKEWKQVTTYGWAREEESKKGMDWAMLSGCSSSYARKYWLCWLLAIDDGIDSDSTNKGSDDWAIQKEVSTSDQQDAEKARFNKEQLDKFVPIADKYEDADAAIRLIRSKYKLSKTMEWEVRKLYESIKEIKWS